MRGWSTLDPREVVEGDRCMIIVWSGSRACNGYVELEEDWGVYGLPLGLIGGIVGPDEEWPGWLWLWVPYPNYRSEGVGE